MNYVILAIILFLLSIIEDFLDDNLNIAMALFTSIVILIVSFLFGCTSILCWYIICHSICIICLIYELMKRKKGAKKQ